MDTLTTDRNNDRTTDHARIVLGCLVALYSALGTIAIRETVLREPDLWWHIKTGEWMWEHGAFPTTDPFSFTFADQPWIAKEWLSQVIYFAVHSLAGWNGVMVLAAASVALAAAALYKFLSEDLRPILAGCVTLVALLLASPAMSARPHLLTMVLVVIWTHQLFAASQRREAPAFGWLLLLLLWANLHAAFTFGFVIALFAFLDFLERTRLTRREMLLRWVAFLALCPTVTLLNPYSYQAILITWSVVGPNEAVPLIGEWQPFNAQSLMVHEFALLGLVFMSLVSGFRLGIARALFIAVMLHLFLTHLRYAYIMFPTLPIVVAPAIAAQFPRLSAAHWRAQPRDRLEHMASWHFKSIIAGLAALLAVMAALQAFVLPTAPPESIAATTALAYVKSKKVSGNVMNAYNYGGALIYNGIPTFIDGRADQLFLGGFTKQFAYGPDNEADMIEALRKYNIRWTLLYPDDPRTALLDKLPGWKRAFEDKFTVIHRRVEDLTQ
ncbi:hypothetical protein [Aestuariivirga sp.]|uniref:hypothetical protein n=1 Tax=Aestuariivirga sp. TaxID=2650926 RepID=UPI00391B9EB1